MSLNIRPELEKEIDAIVARYPQKRSGAQRRIDLTAAVGSANVKRDEASETSIGILEGQAHRGHGHGRGVARPRQHAHGRPAPGEHGSRDRARLWKARCRETRSSPLIQRIAPKARHNLAQPAGLGMDYLPGIAALKGRYKMPARARLSGPPKKMPWGGSLAYFFDQDDNSICLVENPREAKS